MKVLAIYTCFIGLMNVIGGASKDSRWYRIDDIVVRVMGLLFIALGEAMLLGWRWMEIPLMVVYVVSIVEAIVTIAPKHRAVLPLMLPLFVIPLLVLLFNLVYL